MKTNHYFSLETQKFMLTDDSHYAEYLHTGVYRLPSWVSDHCGITAPLLNFSTLEDKWGEELFILGLELAQDNLRNELALSVFVG